MIGRQTVKELGQTLQKLIAERGGPQAPGINEVEKVLASLEDRVNAEPEICFEQLRRIAADHNVYRPHFRDDKSTH